jgi:hypothetical protein
MGIVERSEEMPQEWLLSLEQDRGLYRRLLDECQSLALAAHAVARARCRIRDISTAIPSVSEVGAAAREVARRAGVNDPLPRPMHLADECEAAGLPVIGARMAA